MVGGMQCVFCLTKHGSFTSEEHIVPESLGNTKYVLPRGTVCDNCNNTVLAGLDSILVKDKIIAYLRTYFMVPNKEGKMPEVRMTNLNMQVKPDRSGLYMEMAKTTPKHYEEGPRQPDGSVNFRLHLRGDKMTTNYAKNFARALYKIAYEFMCLDRGAEYVLQPRFDEARQIIMGVRDFKGFWVVVPGTPENKCEFSGLPRQLNGRQSFFFKHNIYGITYGFDMENRELGLSAEEEKKLKEMGVSVITW